MVQFTEETSLSEINTTFNTIPVKVKHTCFSEYVYLPQSSINMQKEAKETEKFYWLIFRTQQAFMLKVTVHNASLKQLITGKNRHC